MYEKYLNMKKVEFENRNYVSFLSSINEMERTAKQCEKVLKES